MEEDDDLPTNRYLYIDGGCLRATTKGIINRLGESHRDLEINLRSLASGYDRVFYYDAISAQGHHETIVDYRDRVEQEHERFDRIRALDSFHVILGEIKGRANKRQKRVDVNLAVDMMMHTFRRNMGSATLLAGDDDFIPLIEALVREGMKVRVWHPPQATSELLAAADHRQPFDLSAIYHYFEEDGSGRAFDFKAGGEGMPPADDSSWSWERNGHEGSATYSNDHLTVWRNTGGQWNWQVLHTPRSSVQAAAGVFSAVQKCPVYGPAGEDFTWSD